MLDELKKQLIVGHRKFGDVTVDINTGGPGGRYQAYVSFPTHNTVIGTPDTVHIEGRITFCERLATALLCKGVRPNQKDS